MSELRIGLTMRVVEATEYTETRDALSQDWPRFMAEVLPEALWTPLPNLGSAITDHVRAWNLNGFIITGGNGLFEYPGRDATELALLEYALEHDLPIFGVCRGLQIMAHYFGYKTAHCPHDGHVGTRHDVWIETKQYDVNSYHHNCIQGSGVLHCFALSEDGQIEALRHPEKKLVAVMWHPEREYPVAGLDRRMVRECFGLIG